jgi:hypothetical protein
MNKKLTLRYGNSNLAQIMEINKRTATLAMEQPRKLCHVMIAPGCHKTGTHLYGSLSRKQTANLTKLRTGHCGLNDFLHRRTIVDNPGCPTCGDPNEMIQHYLLHCPTYKESRMALAAIIGSQNINTPSTLWRKQSGWPNERKDIE